VASARAFFARHWPSLLFSLLALGIWAWVSYEAAYLRMVTWEGGADYWEHSATLHALIESPFHPRHPHLDTLGGSPRFGPQFVLIALVCRVLHWDALRAMTLASVLNTLLFLSGIRVFFWTYFRHPLAPLYGLLVMFGGWWLGFHYSNVYALPVFFSVSAFPSTTALGLTLLGFALVVRLLRGEVTRRTLSLSVLGLWAAAVFIIHPLTAVMSISGALLLAAVQPNVTWRVRFEVAGVVLLGCALSHFWPYFSPWVVIRGGHGQEAGWAAESVKQAADLQVKRKLHEFYQTSGLLQALGLGLLTLLALPWFFLKRERWFVALGALSMGLPFVANAFVELPLGHRFVLLAIFYLHIGVVWLLLGLTPGHAGAFGLVRRRWVSVLTSLCVAATLGVFFAHGVQLAWEPQQSRRLHTRSESYVISNMRAVAAAAGPDSVVLANLLLSWPLPTFGPKVIALYHEDPLVADALAREVAVKRFLAPWVKDEERPEILARYRVSHVLLGPRDGGAAARFLAKISTVQVVGTGYRLYALDPALRKAPGGR
jgi:hypothetical protein